MSDKPLAVPPGDKPTISAKELKEVAASLMKQPPSLTISKEDLKAAAEASKGKK